MMMELEKLEVDVRDWQLRAGADPGGVDAIERTVPVRPRRKKVTVALDADVATLVPGPRRGLPPPDQRGAAHLHAGADLEGDAEPGRHEPARGGDLGEGGAEGEGVRGAAIPGHARGVGSRRTVFRGAEAAISDGTSTAC